MDVELTLSHIYCDTFKRLSKYNYSNKRVSAIGQSPVLPRRACIPSKPTWSEDTRLKALRDFDILDTPFEAEFDEIVKLASQFCDTPIAIVNLIDEHRQWFKSEVGFGVRETPLDNSICKHAILQSEMFIIPDTTKDERFNFNPLVTGDPKLRFYAGALLQTKEGLPLGTLCVLDYKPRELSETQLFTLKALARQVMTQFELRRALKEQRRSDEAESYLGAIITSSDDAIISKDLHGNITSWNPAAERIFGHTEKEAVGKHISIIIPPEYMSDEDYILGQIKSGNKVDHFEAIRRAKSGQLVSLSVTVSPIRNRAGEIIGASKVARDMSLIKDAERASAYLGAIIESSDDAIISKDLNGVVTSWNKAAERIFGYSAEEIIGKPITVLIPPERLKEEEQILTTLKTGKRVDHFETMRRHKNGNMVQVSLTVSPIRDTSGKIIGASKVSRDITERLKVEKDLYESERFSQSVIDSSPDCIKILDLQGRLLSMNANGCIQMEIDDIVICINKEWTHFWQGREHEDATKALEAALRGDTGRFEGYCATMKGTAKWWEVIVSPILGADGKPKSILSVSRDITERKKLENEAIQAQERAEAANIAKTEFLANMSHEIRTPMNAVIGLSHILAKSSPLSPKQQEYIKTLQMSADSLLSLINDLLDIAKIEARNVELEHIPFSVVQMVQETISMTNVRAREKGLSFTVVQECPCIEKRQVVGDPTRLRQILLNLCSNAIKFTEKGGVTLHISCDDTQIEGKEIIRIAVKDTGIGIPANKIDDIFQKFTQADASINRKYGGTGLGLAITKTLAEIMGGTIELSSELGIGSTFTVSIPFDVTSGELIPQYTARPSPAESANATGQKGRILLVEDYAPNILVATTFLESFGYAIDVANNGQQAIDKMKASQYLAALMDVQMHGMNGLEATQIIRAYEKQHGKPRTYIIGMTAHALVGDRERCIAVGMDDYMSKPFNPDKLEEMLGQLAERAA